jgi:maltose alpha-D-glucosyltransferase/alpha-amylase
LTLSRERRFRENLMPAWLSDAVFYEVYPQSFCDTNADGIGDIEGITSKLDYVRGLGCNAIWINPCFVSPFNDGGYDIADYRTVAPRYGTNEDLYRLFARAHAAGIRVLLDLVPGHTSDQHPWFRQSALPTPNEFTNRYIWTDSVWNCPRDLRCVSGRFARNANYIVNFFSTQPALNYGFARATEPWQLPPTHPDCLATCAALMDIMRFWLDQGCDGFRVDMADYLVKNDDDRAATSVIWHEVRSTLDAHYPDAALVSEWSDPERSLGCGFHADFILDHEDNWSHGLFRRTDPATGAPTAFFCKRDGGDVSFLLDMYQRQYRASREHGYMSFITGNHDTPRMRRTLDESELKLAYAFLFTMPGVPFLYYGDEIGMRYVEGLVSKEGGYERTGSRTPMQWHPGPNLGFSEAPADRLYLPVDASPGAPTVEAQARDQGSLLNTVRDILHLRHANVDLQADAAFDVVHAEKGASPFIYRRGRLLLAVNPLARAAAAPVDMTGTVLMALGDPPRCSAGETTMAPQSFVIVRA